MKRQEEEAPPGLSHLVYDHVQAFHEGQLTQEVAEKLFQAVLFDPGFQGLGLRRLECSWTLELSFKDKAICFMPTREMIEGFKRPTMVKHLKRVMGYSWGRWSRALGAVLEEPSAP